MYSYHNPITTRQKGSGSCCAAVGCSLRAGTNLFSEIKMIKFPNDPIRRKQWVAALRRKDWAPTRHTAICSKHFISGKKSNDPHNPDYIPSIFAHNEFPLEEHEESETEENDEEKPSRDPSNPDYAPSLFEMCKKKTETSKPAAGKKGEKIEKKDDGWTSLLNLQPISSEASTSGLKVPPQQPTPKTKAVKPKKSSSEADVSDVPKSKAISKPKGVQHRKRFRSPSPTPIIPTISSTEDLEKLCIVKMEIEDDGYSNNEDESFLANLTPSSPQESQDSPLSISMSSSSIKTELNRDNTPNIIIPTTNSSGSSLATDNKLDVEDFFNNIATTVVQFPPHLIEETKTKVSALVYEMVIRAINEGCNNITQ